MSARSVQAWADVRASHSKVPLMWGPTDVDRFICDPKRIAFFMSRYKFAAKMLSRCRSIVDVGCGSGMGTLTLLHDTDAMQVLGLDFESLAIDHAVKELLPAVAKLRDDVESLEFVCCDFMTSPYVNFDGLCCLDTIEHVDRAEAATFIERMAGSLTASGIAVVGTPSLASAEHGSSHSRIGHINLYDADRLRQELSVRFRHVFMFSMNDEVVHTGFDKLAHYLIALCVK